MQVCSRPGPTTARCKGCLLLGHTASRWWSYRPPHHWGACEAGRTGRAGPQPSLLHRGSSSPTPAEGHSDFRALAASPTVLDVSSGFGRQLCWDQATITGRTPAKAYDCQAWAAPREKFNPFPSNFGGHTCLLQQGWGTSTPALPLSLLTQCQAGLSSRSRMLPLPTPPSRRLQEQSEGEGDLGPEDRDLPLCQSTLLVPVGRSQGKAAPKPGARNPIWVSPELLPGKAPR